MADNVQDKASVENGAPNDAVAHKLQSAWGEHRGAAVLFALGVILELASVYFSYRGDTASDALFSLAAGCLLVAGSISVIARIGYYTHLAPLAAVLFILSKALAFSRSIPQLNDVALLGAHSSLNVAVEGGLFSVGAMLILVTAIRVAIEIQRARRALELRHEALLEETREREKTERALRVSENLHNALMDNVPDGIYYKDAELRITKINRAQARVFGLEDPDEAIGKTGEDFFAAQYAAHLRGTERAILESGVAAADRVELEEMPGGRQRWVSTTQAPIYTPGGAIAGLVGICRDISERRAEAEERLRLVTALEQTGESVIIADAAGKIEYVNPAFERTTGYTAREAQGKALGEWSGDSEAARAMNAAIAGGTAWRGRIIGRKKSGKRLEEDVALSPVLDAAGALINFVALKHDVTHEVSLEHQLLQAQKMDALGKLAGGVAHDFRNVLTIARGNCEMALLQLAPGDPLRPHLEKTIEALESGNSLVRQILGFSRQSAPAPCIFSLAGETVATIGLIEISIAGKVRIETDIAPNAGPIRADRIQVQQVIVNLCNNALEAMSGKDGRLTVRVAPAVFRTTTIANAGTLAPGDYVCLSIEDTGAGIPADVVERIFEPFFTTKEQGTGFGLPTVHGIVTAAGGAIVVNSVPGRGTAFHVYFPRCQGEELPGKAPAEDTQARTPRHGRVLVVDDDADMRDLAAEALGDLGYETVACGDPRHALELLAGGAFDVVLSDLHMPEISGVDLARACAQRGIRTPFVLMSGFGDETQKESPQGAHIAGWLEKPFSIDGAGAALQKALAGG